MLFNNFSLVSALPDPNVKQPSAARVPRQDSARIAPIPVRKVCQWAAVAGAALAPKGIQGAPTGGEVVTYLTPNGALFGVHTHRTHFWDGFIFREVKIECNATQTNVPFNLNWPLIGTATYYNGNLAGVWAQAGEVYAPDPAAVDPTYLSCVLHAMDTGNCNADAAAWGLGTGLGFGVPALVALGIGAICITRSRRKLNARPASDAALGHHLGVELAEARGA